MRNKRTHNIKKFALAGFTDILLFVLALGLISIFSVMSFSRAYLIAACVLALSLVIIYQYKRKRAG